MDMAIRVKSSMTMKSARFLMFAAMGRKIIKMTERMVPTKMKGVRLPRLVMTLSDSAPKMGSMNSAKILSSAMIAPDRVSPILKKYFRIKGMMLSYICQKALIARNANPMRTVRL